jgi:outer membrane protein TolC
MYETSKQLELIQKQKLDNEQKEYKNGRSTTYQLLMFAQDLAQAELARLESAYRLALLDIQLSLYQDTSL